MTIGILKESVPETRVSLLPDAAATLTKQNITVQVEKNAGANAYAFDKAYQTKSINVADRSAILSLSEIILSINILIDEDIEQ
jgi:NAD(P) transhydrogenase subunit alpha